jgi:hypothetical protein
MHPSQKPHPKSLFFDITFGTQFSEGADGSMWLQDETPETITLFIQYLYHQKIPEGNSQQYLDSLYELYIFAEKKELEKLMDATIDAIRFTCNKFNKFIDKKTLLLVYQNTLEGSGLRKFAHVLFVYGHYRNRKQVIRTERKLHQRRQRRTQEKHTHYYALHHPMFQLNKEELLIVHEICRDQPELFCDVMDTFTKEGKFMADPRRQVTGEECSFHCHNEADPCGEDGEEREERKRYWIDDHGRKTSKRRKIVEESDSEEDNCYVNRKRQKVVDDSEITATVTGRGSGYAARVNGLWEKMNEDAGEQNNGGGGEQSRDDREEDKDDEE